MSIDGEAQRQGAGDVAQLAPGQRRGEQDVDVAAAGRRDVGDVPGAEALEQLAELGAPGGRRRRAGHVVAARVEVRASIRPVAEPGS